MGALSRTRVLAATAALTAAALCVPAARAAAPRGLGSSATAGAPQPSWAPAGHRTLVFDDEFTGAALDTATWTTSFPWARQGGACTRPANPGESAGYAASQATVDGDGLLHLRAVARACAPPEGGSYPYTSGMVTTAHSFNPVYGAFEARLDLPRAAGGGIADWPALWQVGRHWPADGENDVMEGLGGRACFTYHHGGGQDGSICPSGDHTGWHTFGSDWRKGSVTYYYDGRQVGRYTEGITSAPQYLVLDLAVGGCCGGPTRIPAELRADWVRYWR